MLELIAVVVLLGLIAGIAIITVGGQMDQARLARSIEQIRSAEQREREAVQRGAVPGGVTFDSRKQSLRFTSSATTITMPSEVAIVGVDDLNTSEPIDRVLYSQSGQSRSYSVTLRAKSGLSKRLDIIGLSGQQIVSDQ